MMRHSRLLTAGALALVAMTACSDPLGVGNKNDPETDRVLATPADVEALIRDSYILAKEPMLASEGINMQIANVAHESQAMAANFGMVERSAFPRSAINNIQSDQFSGDYYEMWKMSYGAIRSASDGLMKMSEAGYTIGTAADDARARAFAKFVLGLAHANLAVTYDKASIYDETVPVTEVKDLIPYGEVMTAALAYMDEAISIAKGTPGVSFPEDWLGVAVDANGFARIVSSFKARYRTQVARNETERAAVDWLAAIADVDAGITETYEVVDDDNRFDFWMHDYMSFYGAWNQLSYFIRGMADTSGAYQTWMGTPIGDRTAMVIQTPDKRFPQGKTLAEQRAAPGLYVRAKTNDTGEGGWVRAERGTWRWSHYLDHRYAETNPNAVAPYYKAQNGNVGVALPIIAKSEMDLIKAEGLVRLGRAGEALPIINLTRVGNGGLPAATLAGAPGGNACVPKLYDGTCGDLLEVIKWEKRTEQFMTVYGGWFFDSRGWGDLAAGTALHYPVPAKELEVRQLPLYTFGGSGEASAPVGNYGY